MVRNKFKQVWGAVSLKLKCATGFMAGVVGVLAEVSAESDEDTEEESYAGYFNYLPVKLDEAGDPHGVFDGVDHQPGFIGTKGDRFS